MAFSSNAWDQIKNKTADDLVSALERDGWALEPDCKGAIQVYRHTDGRRVGIHYHPQKTYGPKLLKGLLSDIGWDEKAMRRLKLIK
jgi:predicted RNA binding protein YcfA (HicA-like mRNA interferase family)